MEMVYYEYRDTDDQWYCGCMEADKALACAIAMGKDFHFLDRNMIIFKE